MFAEVAKVDSSEVLVASRIWRSSKRHFASWRYPRPVRSLALLAKRSGTSSESGTKIS
jgi:hypothetical protein